MVQKLGTVALASMVMVAGMHAHSQTADLLEARQLLEEVLFADEEILRSMPEFEEVAVFDDLGLEGLEEFFAFNGAEDSKVKSRWELFREYEYGLADDELTLRQRMRLVGLLLLDSFEVAGTFVNVEINRMREQFSSSLNGLWEKFVHETHGDKQELTGKERALVVAAMARSFSAAMAKQAALSTYTAGHGAVRAAGRGSLATARFVHEKTPIVAAGAYRHTRHFASRLRDDTRTLGNFLACQTVRAGGALKRGSVIASKVVTAGVRSAHEALRDELN